MCKACVLRSLLSCGGSNSLTPKGASLHRCAHPGPSARPWQRVAGLERLLDWGSGHCGCENRSDCRFQSSVGCGWSQHRHCLPSARHRTPHLWAFAPPLSPSSSRPVCPRWSARRWCGERRAGSRPGHGLRGVGLLKAPLPSRGPRLLLRGRTPGPEVVSA